MPITETHDAEYWFNYHMDRCGFDGTSFDASIASAKAIAVLAAKSYAEQKAREAFYAGRKKTVYEVGAFGSFGGGKWRGKEVYEDFDDDYLKANPIE
jgi:hypothetical protein